MLFFPSHPLSDQAANPVGSTGIQPLLTILTAPPSATLPPPHPGVTAASSYLVPPGPLQHHLFHVIIRGILFSVTSDQALAQSPAKASCQRQALPLHLRPISKDSTAAVQPLGFEHTMPQGLCTRCPPSLERSPVRYPHGSPSLPSGLCSHVPLAERLSVCTCHECMPASRGQCLTHSRYSVLLDDWHSGRRACWLLCGVAVLAGSQETCCVT